jgi:hypothetical protein
MLTPDDDKFYVFVNLLNPTTEHSLHFVGEMMSAGFGSLSMGIGFEKPYIDGTAQYAPLSPNPDLTLGARSLFTGAVSTNYEVEYDAEYVRLLEFPRFPSRFSCLYAFKALEDRKRASDIYHWDMQTVRSFQLLPHDYNRVTRANMEIVSSM